MISGPLSYRVFRETGPWSVARIRVMPVELSSMHVVHVVYPRACDTDSHKYVRELAGIDVSHTEDYFMLFYGER